MFLWFCNLPFSFLRLSFKIATKNGVELCQKSVGAFRCSLATSYNDKEANWNRQAHKQADRRTDKPAYWEAASPKILFSPPKIAALAENDRLGDRETGNRCL